MLSVSKPLSFSQAEDYLQKENYYQQNSEKGYFYGNEKILEKLGIVQGQEVDTTTYLNLLKAYNPSTGEPLLRNSDDEENRRVGIDLTTSAPKSISIIEEYLRATGKIEEADKIREAVDNANFIAMEKAIEYAKTRVYDDEGNRVHTSEVETIRATFQHDTSRLNKINNTMDMQLHNHNMIFNLVLHKDKFYSLSNEELYKQKMFLGQVYRNELAKNMKDLGYKIEIVDYEKGFFEIKGIDRDLIEHFSGRSKDILAKIDEYREKYPNMEIEKLEGLIAQNEKNVKRKDINRDELLKENLGRMEEVGLTDTFIESLKKENLTDKKELNIEEMQSHIYNSLKFLEENNSTFSKEDILKESLKYGMDKGYVYTDYESIYKDNDYIVEFENEIFSTHTITEAEKNVIEKINDKNYSISDKFNFNQKDIDDFLENSKFNNFSKGQKEMFENILKSDYQYTIVQGDAGTGKTYSMEALNEFLKDKDIEIKGMSFTGKASENLQKDSQIQSDTVAKFIIEEMKNKTDIQKERLLIVDEAGMLGSLDFAKLQEIAKKNNDKLILVGDKKQLTAVSQGKLFFETQNHSKNIVFLDEAQRFKTDHAKEIVNKAIEKNLSDSFKIIDQKKGLKEMDKDEQIKAITKDFTNQSPKKMANTGIIASLNADKKALNDSIRTALKMEENSIKFKVKDSVDLKGVAKKYNTSYEKDMLITLSKKVDGFKVGETLKIVGIDKEDKTKVLVVNSNGNVKNFNLNENSDKFSVYKEIEKSFSQGEIIKFNKNIKNKEISVKNGERATIKSLKENGDVILENGKKFNINKMNFVDYGYVYSVHEAQGQTFPVTLAMIDSRMNNYEANYSALTRMKYHIKIYTDSKEDLIRNSTKNQEKASTIGLKRVEKYKANIEIKNNKTHNLHKNKIEKYIEKVPLKMVQNNKNYGIMLNKLKGDKNEKISSFGRIQRRLSKPVVVKVRGKIVTNSRNSMRVLSALEVAIKRRTKLLLSANTHNKLEQRSTKQSDTLLRRANSSNFGNERTIAKIEKLQQVQQEIQKQKELEKVQEATKKRNQRTR